jgi:hypothetical protein
MSSSTKSPALVRRSGQERGTRHCQAETQGRATAYHPQVKCRREETKGWTTRRFHSKNGKVHKEIRTFGTTTRELLALREWLLSQGCTHVAMEITGVYWKPVSAVLEGGALEIVVANAQHVKKVPGRKTDVKDAEWITDLLCHGLLRPSFVPQSRQIFAHRLDECNPG